jgi:preprotein translocase subunit SecB
MLATGRNHSDPEVRSNPSLVDRFADRIAGGDATLRGRRDCGCAALLAEEKIMAEAARGNGEAGVPLPAAEPVQLHQLIINAQYIKDLSFENPRAPQSLIQPTAQPEVAINVDVKARNLGPDVFEVVLTVNVTARAQTEPVFIVELAYAAVVTVKNTPEPMLPALILVETPRLIFPFARAIIADATRDGGFPPLMINPIDFAELLRRQPPTADTIGTNRV